MMQYNGVPAQTTFERCHVSIAEMRILIANKEIDTTQPEIDALEDICNWWSERKTERTHSCAPHETISEQDKLGVAIMSCYMLDIKNVLVITQTTIGMNQARFAFCGSNSLSESFILRRGLFVGSTANHAVPWSLRTQFKPQFMYNGKFRPEYELIIKNMASATAMESFPDKEHFDLVIVVLSNTKRKRFAQKVTATFSHNRILFYNL